MLLNFSSADAAAYFYTRLQTRQAQMAHLNAQYDKTHSDLPQAPTTEMDAPDQLRADAARAAIEQRVQARLREALEIQRQRLQKECTQLEAWLARCV